jgi:DNA polymerase I-like protein with 3'-5' exonuclease and polymerase domains
VGLLVKEGEALQKWYFERFPEIPQWQNRVVHQLTTTKTLTNIFGYKRFFFDRIEGTKVNEAVAWLGQSSVAVLINKIFAAIEEATKDVEILLQVHDSLVGQFRTALHGEVVEKIQKASQIVLPYSDPLIIPVGIKTSTKSWGDCE